MFAATTLLSYIVYPRDTAAHPHTPSSVERLNTFISQLPTKTLESTLFHSLCHKQDRLFPALALDAAVTVYYIMQDAGMRLGP